MKRWQFLCQLCDKKGIGMINHNTHETVVYPPGWQFKDVSKDADALYPHTSVIVLVCHKCYRS